MPQRGAIRTTALLMFSLGTALSVTSLLSGCGSKASQQSTATTARGVDAETQKVLDNPNASPAEKQAASARVQANTSLADSEKMNLLQRLK